MLFHNFSDTLRKKEQLFTNDNTGLQEVFTIKEEQKYYKNFF